jgi:hypothetical protein
MGIISHIFKKVAVLPHKVTLFRLLQDCLAQVEALAAETV